MKAESIHGNGICLCLFTLLNVFYLSIYVKLAYLTIGVSMIK